MKKTAEATKSKTEVWKILGTHSISSSVICSKSSIKRILEELTTGLPGKKHYSLAKQINSVLHCRGGNTKWLVLKPLFFFFPSVNRVCCVYTLPFQLRWMALVRVFKAAFCTFLSYSRARAHTHTHIILQSFFSKKSTGIQKSVPPSRKKRQVKTAVVLCSLWKCQRCTQTSVGLVCSTRGEHKSCDYKKIWLLFFLFRGEVDWFAHTVKWPPGWRKVIPVHGSQHTVSSACVSELHAQRCDRVSDTRS